MSGDQRTVIIGLRRRAMQHAHVLPRHIQFLCHQSGQRALHPLAHLGTRRDDGHAFLINDQIGVQRHRARFGFQRVFQRLFCHVNAKGHATGHSGRGYDKRASGILFDPSHAYSPRISEAAVLIAARIRP